MSNRGRNGRQIEIDMEIDINDIDEKLFRIIKQFSPFGPQNLPPVFVSRNVVDNGYGKQVGVDKSHLRINAITTAAHPKKAAMTLANSWMPFQ